MDNKSVIFKKWIDNATYNELLYRWRFGKTGDPIFQGDIGEYFSKIMREKRSLLNDAEQVQSSKRVGWDD